MGQADEASAFMTELRTPQDMLEKARRELARFESQPCVDHAFNFFVTVYHVRDWASARGMSVTELAKDPDFELCRLACNQGKHLRLTGHTEQRATARDYVSHGDVAFSGVEQYAILADGERIDVSTLGRRVLRKAEEIIGK